MTTAVECIPCFIKQAAEALALSGLDDHHQARVLRKVMRELAELDWQLSPPMVAARMHATLRDLTGNCDPYRHVKNRMNRLAMDVMPECRARVAGAADPRVMIVRLAIAGNLLDCGAKHAVTPEDLPRLFAAVEDRPLAGDPRDLFAAAEASRRILFLTDNAGEIVLDRLLIEALPVARTTVAVRGGPILNDALHEDAAVAGLTTLVPVIGNGSAVPGTVLGDCSAEFRTHFERADLIIAKGQGNYESLAEVSAPLYFLFTVKCPMVARQTGEAVGTMIVRKSPAWRSPRRERENGR